MGILKESVKVTQDCYNTPNTIPLSFRFEAKPLFTRKFATSHYSLEGKDLFTIGGFFTEEEGSALRAFSETTSFSQKIYGSPESIEKGEVPAKMMNGKERWEFFAKPPTPIGALFDFFGHIAYKLDAHITTMPWCLSDQNTTSNCLATNFLYQNTKESERLGKHEDYNPQKGLAYAIPSLYADKEYITFANGAPGHPLMITVMVYATAENFKTEYGMGTYFYDKAGNKVKISCQHMQLIFFEGDIPHTIEESHMPDGVETWRVSYVFKLILNPQKPQASLREALRSVLNEQADQH